MLTRFAIAAFTFGPSENNTISLLIGSPLSARASNTGKYRTQQNTGNYRTATKIQKFTGLTGPLGSLLLRVAGVGLAESKLNGSLPPGL